MAYDYWYVYECVESSETRGSSAIAGRDGTTKKTPCGLASVRATKELINENNQPQARKCDKCGNRPRLNKGNTTKCPESVAWVQEPRMLRRHDNNGYFQSGTKNSNIPNCAARKEWAVNEKNRRNTAHLITSSNASEQVDETIEYVDETIEYVDDGYLEQRHAREGIVVADIKGDE